MQAGFLQDKELIDFIQVKQERGADGVSQKLKIEADSFEFFGDVIVYLCIACCNLCTNALKIPYDMYIYYSIYYIYTWLHRVLAHSQILAAILF